MIKSMTGYGKALCRLKSKTLQVEIRALNSKNLDVFFRIPHLYKEKEPVFRNMVSNILERGKIEVVIIEDSSEKPTGYSLNKPLFKKYYRELKELSEDLGMKDNHSFFPDILRLPEVLITEPEEISGEDLTKLENSIREALEDTDNYRISEGKHMEKDMKDRVENISGLLEKVEPFEAQRIETIKQKIHKSLLELNVEHDSNRFEQELIYYLEKLDINEEKARLANHVEYFIETLCHNSSNNGKKLGFIAQEIGREINTLGSKASDANIQKIVIQMKDELEKMKEQLLNIL